MWQFTKEVWAYILVRKKFWLLPLIIIMAVLGSAIVLAPGSAIAPFLYTIY